MTEKNEIAVSFIKLFDRTLILPEIAIVETVPLSMPQVVTKMPRWFLGFLPWQGLRIPFISFESATGSAFKINMYTKIVVLKTTTPDLHAKFFALLVQEEPINRTVKKELLLGVVGEISPLELGTVRLELDNIVATIPNIIALEELMIKTGVLN